MAALSIAKIPARIGSGNRGQAATTTWPAHRVLNFVGFVIRLQPLA
jgi:hypothetical protein